MAETSLSKRLRLSSSGCMTKHGYIFPYTPFLPKGPQPCQWVRWTIGFPMAFSLLRDLCVFSLLFTVFLLFFYHLMIPRCLISFLDHHKKLFVKSQFWTNILTQTSYLSFIECSRVSVIKKKKKKENRKIFDRFRFWDTLSSFSFRASSEGNSCIRKRERTVEVEIAWLGITRAGTRLAVNACFHKSRHLLCRIGIDVAVGGRKHRDTFWTRVCNFQRAVSAWKYSLCRLAFQTNAQRRP